MTVVHVIFTTQLCILVLITTCCITQAVTSTIMKPLPAEALQVFSSLAEEYGENCLRVGVAVDWSDSPHVTLLNNREGRMVLSRLKDTTFGVSDMNCMILLLAVPPSTDLLTSLKPRGTTKRCFLVLCESLEEAHSFLMSLDMREEEDVVTVIQSKGEWNAYIRYLYTASQTVKVRKVLSWQPREEIKYVDCIFPEQMKNFYGKKFRASTSKFRPFFDFKRLNGTKTLESSGLDVYILREVAKRLNLIYDIVRPEDGLWGTRLLNVSKMIIIFLI